MEFTLKNTMTDEDVENSIKVMSISEESDYILTIHGERNEDWTLEKQTLLHQHSEKVRYFDLIEIQLSDGTMRH